MKYVYSQSNHVLKTVNPFRPENTALFFYTSVRLFLSPVNNTCTLKLSMFSIARQVTFTHGKKNQP